jgi:WD40 repeat protein
MSLPDRDDSITTLSWGMSDELLVGSASLTIFSTHNATEPVWTKPLADAVKFAQFSPDAELIASTGTYDRLLKIWRRIAFGSADEQHFDHSYLPHPAPITGLHWRRPFHKEQQADNVLYTICADNRVRIWVPGEHHGVDGLHLWADVDLMESIKPRMTPLSQQSRKRYAFFIDGKYFTYATERAVQQASAAEKDQVALHHLIEVANRSPEICVVLDDRGNMSAWGFENIGAKSRKTSDVFNIAHVDGLHLHFAPHVEGLQDNVQFYAFCGDKQASTFTLLAHHFDGRVEWLESRVDHLFDLSPQSERIQRKAVWTGHSHAIKKVNRTASGRALVSRTATNECIVWVQRPTAQGMTLHRHSTVSDTEHIHRTLLLQDGDFILFLHSERICLWDARGPQATEIMCCEYTLRGKPLCLILIPETQSESRIAHVVTITSELEGICWELRLPPQVRDPVTGRKLSTVDQTNGVHANGHPEIFMEEYSTFDLGSGDDLAFVLPVDPAGTAQVISGFLDTFTRDVAISYTTSGVISTWTARLDLEKHKLDWLLTSTVDTGIQNPSLASGTSIRKAALIDADKTTLTIWDTRSAQLEYEEKFEKNGIIQDLDWSSTPDNQSILAVGFPHRVVIYAQLRYDYLNAGPSWVPIRDVGIRGITPHPIGDSVWLGSGNLVIGAGNQLFIQDEQVIVSESLFPSLRTMSYRTASIDLFSAVSRLNGPLPVYHPQLISQCVLSGKLLLAQRILIKLYQKLKFFSEGDELDSLLGLVPEDFSEDEVRSKYFPL